MISLPKIGLFHEINIENADGTPPHLEVFPAVGELRRFAWFCEVLCDGKLSVFLQEGSSARLRLF